MGWDEVRKFLEDRMTRQLQLVPECPVQLQEVAVQTTKRDLAVTVLVLLEMDSNILPATYEVADNYDNLWSYDNDQHVFLVRHPLSTRRHRANPKYFVPRQG